MKSITYEIFKLTSNCDCVRDCICATAVNSVNSFARREHLFDNAAKPIDVDANLLSYPAPFFQF